MPKEEKMVDLDTSGEGAEINLEEKEQHEKVVEEEKLHWWYCKKPLVVT